MRKRGYLRIAGALAASGLSLVGCGPIGWTRVTINRPHHAQDVAFIVPHQTTWVAFFIEATYPTADGIPLKVTTEVRVLPDVEPYASRLRKHDGNKS